MAPAVLLNNARLCGIAGSAAAFQAGDYIAVNPIKRDGVYSALLLNQMRMAAR